MPKLIDPYGNTVSATAAGARLLVARGYRYPDGAEPPVPAPAAAGWPETHHALDELAAAAGVVWPEPPAGKKRLTVAEKVAALEAAGVSR